MSKKGKLGGNPAKVISTKIISEPLNRKEAYHNFLESDHWKGLRKLKLKRDKCCCVCGSTEKLNIHHAGYKRVYRGKANTALKDTYVLCREHHIEVHKIQHRQGLSWEQTKRILEELKTIWTKLHQNTTE